MTSARPPGAAGPGPHPVTITIDAGHPGAAIPAGFAGLSFERGPLTAGNAGLSGNMFRPDNHSLVMLFRNMGLGNLRIGGAIEVAQQQGEKRISERIAGMFSDDGAQRRFCAAPIPIQNLNPSE